MPTLSSGSVKTIGFAVLAQISVYRRYFVNVYQICYSHIVSNNQKIRWFIRLVTTATTCTVQRPKDKLEFSHSKVPGSPFINMD